MGLRDELVTNCSGSRCAVGKLLNRLDRETASELAELLDDESVQSSALGRLSKAKHWGVGDSSFSRHRRKECSCL